MALYLSHRFRFCRHESCLVFPFMAGSRDNGVDLIEAFLQEKGMEKDFDDRHRNEYCFLHHFVPAFCLHQPVRHQLPQRKEEMSSPARSSTRSTTVAAASSMVWGLL